MSENERTSGLSPENHAEIHSPDFHLDLSPEEKAERLASLRVQYAGDPVALQQIDVGDKSSLYNQRMDEYLKAIHAGDTAKKAELESWFAENYPDIK